MSLQAYGRWLQTQRESVRPRLTQRDLAREAGVSHTYISKLEGLAEGGAAPFEPSEDKIDRISRALSAHVGRSVVNEARRTIGYRLLPEVEEEEVLSALPPLPDNTVDRAYRIVEQLKGLAREVRDLPDSYRRLVKVAVEDDLHFKPRVALDEETEQGADPYKCLAYA